MNEDFELLAKRFVELARKAEGGAYYTFTDFLGLAEQATFSDVRRQINVKFSSFGGAEGAERVMIRFGDENEIGYDVPFPIVCIKAEPLSQKFADKLTHRDFLGALLNLGIERSTLGDIVIIDNVGYIFAKEDIADYIVSTLRRVKHTEVRLGIAETLPMGELYSTETKRITLQSERIDAIIAKVYMISRDDSLSLVKRRLVYVDGRLCESPSYTPKAGEVISVRGYGRMIYRGYDYTTKKGKLAILVDIYV